ncbi:hypothetical protein C0993_001884 [Termitomyces sp. T159_Od127]|nr:hypothetical protein C0993_001884 [Termitomyces sp. T159_Od127]
MSHAALVGKRAPSISLPNYTEETFSLIPGESGIPTVYLDRLAKAVLVSDLYIGSYGCTKEACQFRDAIAGKLHAYIPSDMYKSRSGVNILAEKIAFKPGKVQIIGISPDPVDKQKWFVEKEKLTVISDCLILLFQNRRFSSLHETVSSFE